MDRGYVVTYPFVRSAVDLGRARGPRLAFVVHHAEGGGTVGYLSRPNPNGVSVHFVIERSGRTVQMLELSHMHSSIRANAVRTTDDPDGFFGATAAKAVMGDWARPGRTLGPNHASIAVEIEGFARDGPNTAQKAALKALYADLRKRYPGIRSLGHRDFASYKQCPGKLIPWDQIGGHGKTAFVPKEEPVADPIVAAIQTRTKYLANELAAGDTAGAAIQAGQIVKYASRFLAADDADTDGLFKVFDDENAVYMQGGAAFGNPDGVTLTLGQARAIWEDIFANGFNISKVRSTLLPGSFVLSAEGYAKAVELGKTSTNFAPSDYNPLGLPVVP